MRRRRKARVGTGRQLLAAVVAGALSSIPAARAQAIPPLHGAYTRSVQHPRVFTTPIDIKDLVARISTPGSFSAQAFARLSNRVEGDLGAKIDWDASYAGCDLDIYLRLFSYEPRGGYASDVRSEDQLRFAAGTKPGLSAPAGAAIVASRLALYATLVVNGAQVPAGAPQAGPAAALAKRILMAWAARGLRDGRGKFLNAATQFCDAAGRSDPGVQSAVALQIGRGVVYSVHAQDLLQAIVELSAAESMALDDFHAAAFELIRQAANFRFALLSRPDQACDRYSNHVATGLTSLLAIARLLDDGQRFNAVLTGADRSITVALPWTQYFDRAIYGQSDRPIRCSPNTGAASLTSHPSFQTAVVAPGEAEDRYRNANELQAFGYTMGSLGSLYNSAEMMRNAGIDAYAYRGTHRQSIELATQYYACYGKHVGFKHTVTADNARACPNYQQYVGQLVNDVETPILIGALRFPKNPAIVELDSVAKAESARENALDTLRFGRWTD